MGKKPTRLDREQKAAARRVDMSVKRDAASMRIDLVRGIDDFKKSIPLDKLSDALQRGRYQDIPNIVDTDQLAAVIKAASEPPIAKSADKAMMRAVHDVGLPKNYLNSLENPKLASYVATRTGALITTSEEGMLHAVRTGVAASFNNAGTPADIAKTIRSSIGLNARQAQSVANYRNSLTAAGTHPSKVEALVQRYEQTSLDYRASMIAQTEIRQAQNYGQQAQWEAAHQDGLLPHDFKREWVVDGNPCPEICLPMDGITVGLYEPWTLPDGRQVDLPSSSHPHCQCQQAPAL